MFDFIGRKKIWFTISLIIIVIGMYFWATRGLNVGIDFLGGNVLDLKFEKAYHTSQIADAFTQNGLPGSTVQIIGQDGTEFIINTKHIAEDARQQLYASLKASLGNFTEIHFESVSPVIGQELVRTAVIATAIAIFGMLIYIWMRFEIRFAVAAVLALVHDVLMTVSFFAIFHWTVDSAFIAAILTIIGYSIMDTVVVYDRIREKLRLRKKDESLDDLTNKSINETLRRSVFTSLTTVTAISAVLIFGGSTIKAFSLALVVGILSGTYSSIFIASPLWVIWRNFEERRAATRHASFQARKDAEKAKAPVVTKAAAPAKLAGPAKPSNRTAAKGGKGKGKNR